MITFNEIIKQALTVSNMKQELSRYEGSLLHISKDGFVTKVRRNPAQETIILSITSLIEIESQKLSEMATKFRLKEHYLKAVQECTDALRWALDANAKERIEKIEAFFLVLENKEDLKYELVFPSL
jgi:hypothetical protein